MRQLLLLLLLLFLTLPPLHGTEREGDWTYYPAYNDATRCVPGGDCIYALFAGNLLAYHPADESVRTLTRFDGLSGKGIARIAYCRPERCLVIAYEDLNVDLLYDDGTVVGIPALKNGNDGSVTFADLTVTGRDAVVATSGGLAHFDLGEQLMKNYYRIDRRVTSGALIDGCLFAGTTAGLVSCALADGPYDASQWTMDFAVPVSGVYPFADGLYLQVNAGPGVSDKGLGLWRADLSADRGVTAPQRIFSQAVTAGYVDNDRAAFLGRERVVTFSPQAPATPTADFSVPEGWKGLCLDNAGRIWAAAGFDLLQDFRVKDNTLTPLGHRVGGYGPRRDLCYKLRYVGGRLLVAGGRIDYVSGKSYDGTALYRDDSDEEWHFLPETGMETQYGVAFRNVTDILQDPADASQHYVATGAGLFVYRDGAFLTHYSKNNSSLRPAAGAPTNPAYIRIDALSMDPRGNLIMTNAERDTILQVRTPEGKWHGIYAEGIKGAQSCERSLIDGAGRLWVTSRRTTTKPRHTSGLLCIDYNGTPANSRDDVMMYRSSAYNQDGVTRNLQYVYDLVQDTDGHLWMGCASGLYVINPETWMTSTFRVTQIKVPRNDGTNYADYLLADVPVSAIAIDGGGRKWIGTLNDGLYLVSPDGTEVLKHYKTADSPLLSDCIYALAVSPVTGEVMVGTDIGLCSVRSRSSAPAETLDSHRLHIYPNPVRPDYHGPVTVTGLTLDADVKVTNAAGAVVAAGRSTGGTFTWNGRRANGRRVATGVYYIMVATADGSEGVAGKVVVI